MPIEYQIKDLQERLKILAGDMATMLQRVNDQGTQAVRFDSHFQSELGNFSRRLDDLNRDMTSAILKLNAIQDKKEDRLRAVEQWKSNIEGMIMVLKILIGIMVAVNTALVIEALTGGK